MNRYSAEQTFIYQPESLNDIFESINIDLVDLEHLVPEYLSQKQLSDQASALQDKGCTEQIISICDHPGELPPFSAEQKLQLLPLIANIEGKIYAHHQAQGFPGKLEANDVEHIIIAYCNMILSGDHIPQHPETLNPTFYAPVQGMEFAPRPDGSGREIGFNQQQLSYDAICSNYVIVHELTEEYRYSEEHGKSLDYESWNPQVELWRVRERARIARTTSSLSTEERNNAVRSMFAEYRETLADQENVIAQIQAMLVEAVMSQECETANAILSKCEDVLDEYSEIGKLSYTQLEAIRSATETFAKRLEDIAIARTKYSTDKKLYEACFGIPPEGEIEVIERYGTLYFRCATHEDYTWIYNGDYSMESKRRIENDPKEKESYARLSEQLKNAAGCKVGRSLIPELRGCLTAEKATSGLDRNVNDQVLNHEARHAINRGLYEEQKLRVDYKYKTRVTKDMQPGWEYYNEDEAIDALKKWMRVKREDFLFRVKDEFLAYLQDGELTPEEILETISTPLASKGLYDYVGEWEKEEENNATAYKAELYQTLIQQRSDYVDDLYDKDRDYVVSQVDAAFHNVFINEYKQIIQNAKEAAATLLTEDPDSQHAIETLAQMPIERWPQLVDRQILKPEQFFQDQDDDNIDWQAAAYDAAQTLLDRARINKWNNKQLAIALEHMRLDFLGQCLEYKASKEDRVSTERVFTQLQHDLKTNKS